MFGLVKGKTVELYAEPRSDSEVIGHVAEGDFVEVDNYFAADKFCKIYTAIGLEGYCKKKYISIEK